jgi:hypothetical protein
MLVENNEDIIIISPWYSWKIAHFGIKQQSLTHYILKLIIHAFIQSFSLFLNFLIVGEFFH